MNGAPPPSRRRLAGLEAARGGAATLVVLYHTARHVDHAVGLPLARRLLQFGHCGVDIFFVLSGFIILFVHTDDIGRPARLRHYALRRLTRVFPAYWVALVLTVLMAVPGHGWPGPGALIGSALLLPGVSAPLLGIAWTLQYELVFYVVFGVAILSRRAGAVLFALWAAAALAAAARLWVSPLPPLASTYDIAFFLGLAAAVWVRRGGPVPGWVLPLGLALLAMAAAAEDGGFLDGYAPPARLAYGLPAMLMVAALARGQGRMPFLGALGAASYAVYLFQFCFIGVAWQALLRLGADRPGLALVDFLVLALCAVGGGIAMSRLVEYPLMRGIRRLLTAA